MKRAISSALSLCSIVGLFAVSVPLASAQNRVSNPYYYQTAQRNFQYPTYNNWYSPYVYHYKNSSSYKKTEEFESTTEYTYRPTYRTTNYTYPRYTTNRYNNKNNYRYSTNPYRYSSPYNYYYSW